MGRANDITQTAADRLTEERLAQTVTHRCFFCEWKMTGTLGEIRLMSLQHRTEHHPDAIKKTRFAKRRAGLRALGPQSLDDNIAKTRDGSDAPTVGGGGGGGIGGGSGGRRRRRAF